VSNRLLLNLETMFKMILEVKSVVKRVGGSSINDVTALRGGVIKDFVTIEQLS
jgi:hypothetical protein